MTTATSEVRNEAAGTNFRNVHVRIDEAFTNRVPTPRRNAQGELESYEDYVHRCRRYDPGVSVNDTNTSNRRRRASWERRRDGRYEFERMWGGTGRTSRTKATPDTENSRSVSPNNSTHVRRGAANANPIRVDSRAWFGIHRYFDKSNTMRNIERDVKKLSERFNKLMQATESKVNVNIYNEQRHRRRHRSSSSSE